MPHHGLPGPAAYKPVRGWTSIPWRVLLVILRTLNFIFTGMAT